MLENIGELAPFLWLGILILSAVIEISTVSLVAVWFIPSALLAEVLSLFNLPFWVQALCFFVSSAAFLIFLMPIVRNKLKKKIIKTNVDGLPGSVGTVVCEVDNSKNSGLVSIKGQTWSASSRTGEVLPKGASVTVTAVEGVKAVCEIKEE